MKSFTFGVDWNDAGTGLSVRECKQYRVWCLGTDGEGDVWKFTSTIGEKLHKLRAKVWSETDIHTLRRKDGADFVLSQNFYQWLVPQLDEIFYQTLEDFRKETLAAIANAIG